MIIFSCIFYLHFWIKLYSSDKAEANMMSSRTGNPWLVKNQGFPGQETPDSSGSPLYGHSTNYIRQSNSPQQRAPTIKTAQRGKIEINSSNLSKVSVKYNFLYIYWTFPGRNKCMQLFCYSFKTSATMKMLLAVIVLLLIVEANAQSRNYVKQFAQGQLLEIYHCELKHNCIFFHWLHGNFAGSADMWRAYRDMREANWKESDKYFHARGNYDAARRGPGGKAAAAVIRWVFGSLHRLTGSRCAAAHAWFSVTAIPGKGFRNLQAAMQKTLQPIRKRTAGAGTEAILTVTDQRTFLINISLPAIARKVRRCSQCSMI